MRACRRGGVRACVRACVCAPTYWWYIIHGYSQTNMPVCVCVRACMRVCPRVCVLLRVHVQPRELFVYVHERVCMCVCVCVHARVSECTSARVRECM